MRGSDKKIRTFVILGKRYDKIMIDEGLSRVGWSYQKSCV